MSKIKDNKQTDVKQPSNKVFDLVQFLYDNKDNIKSWEETFEKLNTLRNECDNLKPKTKFENDTKYLEKKRELETKEKKLQQIFDSAIFKDFSLMVNNFSFQEFENITTHWGNNINDANEALKQIKRCRQNYLALPTEAIRLLFYHGTSYCDFLHHLDNHLMGYGDDKGLFAKYIPADELNK